MPAYDVERFTPPAPVAHVTLRRLDNGANPLTGAAEQGWRKIGICDEKEGRCQRVCMAYATPAPSLGDLP